MWHAEKHFKDTTKDTREDTVTERDFSRGGQRGHFAPPENGFAPLSYPQ